ncbi:hypothetical protein [Nereida ignava]|uniref:hypothetical protein n=1 Tax=Nereida ignava TaxID=282199 RepID=UPI0030F73201
MADTKQLEHQLRRAKEEKAVLEELYNEATSKLEDELMHLQKRNSMLHGQLADKASKAQAVESEAVVAPEPKYTDHTCNDRIEDMRATAKDANARYDELVDEYDKLHNEMAAFNISHGLSSES